MCIGACPYVRIRVRRVDVKKSQTTKKLIFLVAIVAVCATLLSLGVFFGVSTPIDPKLDGSQITDPVIAEIESANKQATSAVSISQATVETGSIVDAGNVLVPVTSSTAPSGAVAISNESTLKSFIDGSAEYGYLTQDITIDCTSTNRNNVTSSTLGSTQVLNGNGYSVYFVGYGTADSNWGRLENSATMSVTGTQGSSRVQGLVLAKNDGTIRNLNIVVRNCWSLDTGSGYNAVTGMIAGWNNGVIENCSVRLDHGADFRMHVSGRNSATTYQGAYVGGIAGVNTGTIEYCTTTNNADNWEGEAYYQIAIGGIAGVNNGGRIAYCKFDGQGTIHNGNDGVSAGGDGSAIGGIVGIGNQSGEEKTYGRMSGTSYVAPYVTVASGTVHMVNSSYFGFYKTGAVSKPIGLIAGISESSSTVGWTAYHTAGGTNTNISQAGCSPAVGTHDVFSVTAMIGSGSCSVLYGGSMFFADACRFNVYYDYFSQADAMYIEFDNAAAISSITPKSSSYGLEWNSTNKTLSIDSASFVNDNKFYKGADGMYLGADTITYQGYEANLAYGSIAATVAMGENFSTTGTRATSTLTFPLSGSTDYYLTNDIYIDISSNYSTHSNSYGGTFNGNGFTVYFYGSKTLAPTTTTFGVIANYLTQVDSKNGKLKNVTFSFLDGSYINTQSGSGGTYAGIVTGAQDAGYATEIYNVALDVKQGATIELGNSGGNSWGGMVIGKIHGGASNGIARKIWVNLEGTYTVLRGDSAATYAGALYGVCDNAVSNNLDINRGGGYYIFSGAGTFKTNKSGNMYTVFSVFVGTTSNTLYINSSGSTFEVVYWDWAWRINPDYSGNERGYAVMAGGDNDKNGHVTQNWAKGNLSAYFINSDPSYSNGAFAKSGSSYSFNTNSVTGLAENGTALKYSLDGNYSNYSIYQAMGRESTALSGGISGSLDKYAAQKYVDTNSAYSSVAGGYGSTSTYVRYQSIGYMLSNSAIKLSVNLANKNGTPLGYEYNGSQQGTNVSDYAVVPKGYSGVAEAKRAKVAEVAELGTPSSVSIASGDGINVGAYSISSYGISVDNCVAETPQYASFVIYPKVIDAYQPNSIAKYWDDNSTATFTVASTAVTGKYSTSASSYVETADPGENLAVWTASYTSYTSLPKHIVAGTVVEEGYYTVNIGNNNYAFGKVSQCAVSGAMLLVGADVGEIILRDISYYTMTVTMLHNGTTTNQNVVNNGKIWVDYDGMAYSVSAVSMVYDGATVPLRGFDSSNSLTDVTQDGVTLSFTPDVDDGTYVGTFSFSYYVVPKKVVFDTTYGVHAVYQEGGAKSYYADTTTSDTTQKLVNTADEHSSRAVAKTNVDGLSLTVSYAFSGAAEANASHVVNPTQAAYKQSNDGTGAAASPVWVYIMCQEIDIAGTKYYTIAGNNYHVALKEEGGADSVAETGWLWLAQCGYIHQRVVPDDMTADTTIYFAAKEQQSSGSVLTTKAIAGTASATSSSSTPFETVYSGENFGATAFLYKDEALSTPLTMSAMTAQNAGYYSVSASAPKTGGNYYVESSTSITVWFRILPYEVGLAGKTEVTYGTESLPNTTTYTYTAYGSTLSTTWSGEPSYDTGSITYDKTWTVPTSPRTQDIVGGYYSTDGNYYVPQVAGVHSLIITKATVAIAVNNNTVALGADPTDVESALADVHTYTYTGFCNNDTPVISGIDTLEYEYRNVNLNQAGEYTNAIFVTNPDVLTSDNYVFVAASTGGTLYVKQGLYAIKNPSADIYYAGSPIELQLRYHYLLKETNSWGGTTNSTLTYGTDYIYEVTKLNTATGEYVTAEFRDAGSYKIKFVVQGNAANSYMISTLEISIEKLAVTITAKDHSAEYGYVSELGNSGYVIEGLVGEDADKGTTYVTADNISYVYTYTDGADITDTAAGRKYTLTPVVSGTYDNYTFTAVSGNLVITPRVLDADWYMDSAYATPYPTAGVTYTGSAYTVHPKASNLYVNAGGVADNIILKATGAYSTATNAGTYTVGISVDAASDSSKTANYTVVGSATFSWTINSAPITITAQNIAMGSRIEFSGASNTVFSTGNFELVGDDAMYATITGINNVTYYDAGYYTVTLTVTAVTNYTFADGQSIQIEYDQARVYKQVLVIDDGDIEYVGDARYLGQDQPISFGIADFKAPEYTAIKSVGAKTYINAGTYSDYTVTIEVVNPTNYCIGDEDTSSETYTQVTVVIKGMILTYTADDVALVSKDWQEGGVTFDGSDFAPLDHVVISSRGDSYLKAGKYEHGITLTIPETETNYVFSGDVKSIDLTVDVKVNRVSLPYTASSVVQITTRYFQGEDVDVLFTKDDFGKLDYIADFSVANSGGEQRLAGDYYVTVVLEADDNHCFGDESTLTLTLTDVKATISRAILDDADIAIKQVEIVEYTGSAITFKKTDFSGNFVTIDGVTTVAGQDYVNVGTPLVELHLKADANHVFRNAQDPAKPDELSLTYQAKISNLQVVLSVLDGFDAISRVYDGTQTYNQATSGSIVLGVHYSVEAKDGKAGDYYVSIDLSNLRVTDLNVGNTYLEVPFILNHPQNYEFKDGVSSILLPITTTPAVVKVDNLDARDREYNGDVMVDLVRSSVPTTEVGVVAGDDVSVVLGQGIAASADASTYSVTINNDSNIGVWLTGADSDNYIVEYNAVDVVISKKIVTTVIWSVTEDSEFRFGYESNPVVKATFEGIDNTYDAEVVYTQNDVVTSFVNAGVYLATAQSSNDNYDIQAAGLTLTMRRKMINPTADDITATPSKIYTGSEINFDGSGFNMLAGIASYQVGEVSGQDYVNVGMPLVELTLIVDSNHMFTGGTDDNPRLTKTVDVKVSITQATPTIATAPVPKSIVYRDTLDKATWETAGEATFNGAIVAGTFSWVDASIVATAAGTASYDVLFTPSAIVDGSGKAHDNFTSVIISVSVVVNKATPIITTHPTASPIYFGDNVGASVLSGGDASTIGAFKWVDATPIPSGGTHYFDVMFEPADLANYNIPAYIQVMLTVEAPLAELTLVLDSLTYGEKLSTISFASSTAKYNNTVIEGTFRWQNGDVYPTVTNDSGRTEYVVIWTPNEDNKNNYSETTKKVTITVNQRDLELVTDTEIVTSREYNGSDIAVVTAVGASNKLATDASTTLIATAKYEDKNVGIGKKITISYSLNGTAAGNYKLPDAEERYGDITPKTAIIQWQSPIDNTYDKTVKTVTATVSNVLVGDENTFSIEYKLDGKLVRNEATDAGEYIAEIVTLGNDNYKLVDGATYTWSIQARGVELVWSNGDLTYNGSAQEVAATVKQSDVLEGDTVEVVGYLDDSNVATYAGSYTATATVLSNNNYKISINSTYSYKIASRQIVVEGLVIETSKTYDGTFLAVVDDSSATNNIIAADRADVTLTVSAIYKKNSFGTTKIDVTYTLTGEKAVNYIAPKAEQYDGEITARPVTLVWSETSLTYNGKQQSVTATVTDAITVGGIQEKVNVYYQDNTNKATDAGNYTAIAVLTNNNYTLEGCVNRNMDYVIARAVLTDATQDVYEPYTGKAVALDIVLTGFMQGDSIADGIVFYGEDGGNVNSTTAPTATTVAQSKTVYYRVELANYIVNNDSISSRTITITPAEVELSATSSVLTKEYDGTDAVIGDITSQYYNISSNGAIPSLTIVGTPRYNAATVLDASYIAVQFELEDTANFVFSSAGNSLDINAAITKASITPVAKPSATIIKVYDEKTTVNEPIVEGTHYELTFSTAATATVSIKSVAYLTPQASANSWVRVVFQIADQDMDNFEFATDEYGVVQDGISLSGVIEKALVSVNAVAGYAKLTKEYDGTTMYSTSLLAGVYEIMSTGATPKAVYASSAVYSSANVGTDLDVTVTFANNDPNYAFRDGVNVVVFDGEITPKTATVTVAASSIVYGNIPTAFKHTIMGAVGSDQVLVDYKYNCAYDLDTNRGVGTYDVTMTILESNPNYTVNVAVGSDSLPAKLTVTKASLTITADSITDLHYGDPVPESFSASIVGLISRDKDAGMEAEILRDLSYTCDYVAGDGVGAYAITPSGLNLANYQVTYENGYAIVTQTVVTVRANDVTLTYGDVPGNNGATFYLGGVETDDLEIVGNLTYTYTYNRYDAVGTYAITPNVSSISSGNYAFTAESGKMIVNKMALTVQAGDVKQVYGNTPVNLSLAKYYSILSGKLVNNDRLYGSMEVEEFGNVAVPQAGEYTINRGTLGDSNTNYEVDFVTGTYTIEARQISITLLDQYLNSDDDTIDQKAYTIRSGEIVNNDNLNIVLIASVEEGAAQGTITATYSNPNYVVTFKDAFLRYGKEDSRIVYNNTYVQNIVINIPYDGKAHKIDASCTSGEPIIIQYQGYEIDNSFTEVDVYELVITARASNTHYAPTPVSVRLRIYYENISTESGVDAVISSSAGFAKYDTFVVTEQDKNAVDISEHLDKNQTIVEQYAITLKDADNNNVDIRDGKILLDVPSDELIDNGTVTVLVCEQGVYRLVTAEVIDFGESEDGVATTKKVVINVQDGIEQIAFVQNTSTFDVMYLGIGGLLAVAGIGAIIAIIVIFFIYTSNKFLRRK